MFFSEFCKVVLLGCAEHSRHNSVKQRRKHVHKEYRKGHTLVHSAVLSEYHRQEAEPHAVDDHRKASLWRSRIVRCHKECAEHKTATEQVRPDIFSHVTAAGKEYCGKHHRRADIKSGNTPVYNSADKQIDTADEDCKSAHLTRASAYSSEEHIQSIEPESGISTRLDCGFDSRKRSCARDCADVDIHRLIEEGKEVCAVLEVDWSDKVGHNRRPAQEQEYTRRDCGVGKVFADTAEEHLHHNNGKETADHRHVERHYGRKIEREYHTRDDRRQVTHALIAFADDVEKPLRKHARTYAKHHHTKRIKSV